VAKPPLGEQSKTTLTRRAVGRVRGVLWKVGLAALLIVVLIAVLTRSSWLPWVARDLVCTQELVSADAILVENFDPSYLVFERAAALRRAGASGRVLVPVAASTQDPGVANPVARGIAELMARFARIGDPDIVPIRQVEPYALNAARQVRAFLEREHLRSVIIVTSAFRSKRSALVYRTVLTPVGIRVSCVPVFEAHTAENWTTSWHGIEVVTEQLIKLQFYRFHVLRAGEAQRKRYRQRRRSFG
jgi:uncharacterized SAM-binding protein YcdF (DUF218 family)